MTLRWGSEAAISQEPLPYLFGARSSLFAVARGLGQQKKEASVAVAR